MEVNSAPSENTVSLSPDAGDSEEMWTLALQDNLDANDDFSAEALFLEQVRMETIANTAKALAHDVMRPITLLKTGIQILESQNDMASIRATLRQFSEEADLAIDHLRASLDDYLKLGQRSAVIIQSVFPKRLLENAIYEARQLRRAPGVTIEYAIAHRNAVAANPFLLKRVIAALYENAVKAMNGKGTLSIGTREVIHRESQFVEFSFRNTGSLLTPEEKTRIFEVFFSNWKIKGKGVGLNIARKIVMDHGGTIWCESREDWGTAVLFTIPVHPEGRDPLS